MEGMMHRISQRVLALKNDIEAFTWISQKGYEVVTKSMAGHVLALRIRQTGTFSLDFDCVMSIIPDKYSLPAAYYAEVHPYQGACIPDDLKDVEWPLQVGNREELEVLLKKLIV